MAKPFKKAALGGTFDRLHVGHEQLLTTALNRAEQIVVGVTTDDLVIEKKFSHLIEPFSVRIAAVTAWLKNRIPGYCFEVIPLMDIYGPTLFDSSIDSLIVTKLTRHGGDLVNLKRRELKERALPIIEAEMVEDENGEYVSSTRIRQGLVTRKGMVYSRLFDHDVVFTVDQLNKLHQIQGSIVSSVHVNLLKQFTEIVLVGDVVTADFIENGFPFTYALIDGKTRRKQFIHQVNPTFELSPINSAGKINAEVAQALLKLPLYSNQKTVIKVCGEEDLLAFVSLLSLPLHSGIFYGQPEVGVGMIEVNEATKTHYAKYIDSDFS